jgi:hypothetical protein
VTGVQTCALPICHLLSVLFRGAAPHKNLLLRQDLGATGLHEHVPYQMCACNAVRLAVTELITLLETRVLFMTDFCLPKHRWGDIFTSSFHFSLSVTAPIRRSHATPSLNCSSKVPDSSASNLRRDTGYFVIIISQDSTWFKPRQPPSKSITIHNSSIILPSIPYFRYKYHPPPFPKVDPYTYHVRLPIGVKIL